MGIARRSLIATAAAAAVALTVGCKTSPTPSSPPPPMSAAIDPSHAVPFVGIDNVFAPLLPGGAIVITSIRGPTDRIAVGNAYVIDGAYTLASHDAATLSAYETAAGPGAPHTAEVAGQSVAIPPRHRHVQPAPAGRRPGLPARQLLPRRQRRQLRRRVFRHRRLRPTNRVAVGPAMIQVGIVNGRGPAL